MTPLRDPVRLKSSYEQFLSGTPRRCQIYEKFGEDWESNCGEEDLRRNCLFKQTVQDGQMHKKI